MTKRLVMATFCALLSLPTAAQDLRRLEPEPVPPVAPPPEPEAAQPVARHSGDAPLLAYLNGLVFVAHPNQLREPAELTEQGLDMRRVPLLDRPEFSARLQRWIGQPLSRRDLQRLLVTVNLYVIGQDRPFVHVSVPDQDVTEGVLRVLVVEARLGDVTVSGNRYFGDTYYLKAFGLDSSAPLYRSELDKGLDWIARSNPFHAATVTASPGEKFGTTDLTLMVNERRPWRMYAGASNNGTRTTGTERVVLGGNWGNLFGRGQQLSAQLTASPDFDRSVGVFTQYTAPLPWRHLLRVSAAGSRINADVPDGFDSSGESWQVLAGYEVPLPPVGRLRHAVQFGLDFKRSDNNLEFGGTPVVDNITHIVQAGLGWQGRLPDRYGATYLATRLVHSPGGVTGRNGDQDFADSRWGASADYSYGRLDLRRDTALPGGWGWVVAAVWQQSDSNLLGSEQLALSGSSGVRGYREEDLYADEGVLLRNELLLPPFSPASALGYDTDDRLQLLVFADYARGSRQRRLPGERDHNTLGSVGLGLRYTLGRSLNAGLAFSWQQKALPGEDRGMRAHAAMTLSY